MHLITSKEVIIPSQVKAIEKGVFCEKNHHCQWMSNRLTSCVFRCTRKKSNLLENKYVCSSKWFWCFRLKSSFHDVTLKASNLNWNSFIESIIYAMGFRYFLAQRKLIINPSLKEADCYFIYKHLKYKDNWIPCKISHHKKNDVTFPNAEKVMFESNSMHWARKFCKSDIVVGEEEDQSEKSTN